MLVSRWVQQALDTPLDHPLQPIFWQKFFHCFLSRPACVHEGEEPRGVGISFFSGMINTMYINKIKNFVRKLQEYQDNFDNKDKPICESLSKIYKAFYIWLDESKILDSTLYIPALLPVYQPNKLAQILSGDTTLWLELIDTAAVHYDHTDNAKAWDTKHHRIIVTKQRKVPFIPDSDLTCSERIIKRLQSYDKRVEPPRHHRQTTPIPQVPMSTIVCEEALLHFLESPLSVLNDESGKFSANSSAYGSLNCSFLELSPMLWKDEEVETLIKKTCPGTKRGKEHVDCLGPAKILLKYTESRRQEDVQVKLDNNRKDWEAVETKLLSPPSGSFVSAASSLNSVCNKILRLYEKDLGRGQVSGVSTHHSLALSLFYKVTSCITEDWLMCPSLRHFISDTLELLASVVVSPSPGQAPTLLTLLTQSPHLSPYLSAHFTPNTVDTSEVIHIYRTISELPDGDGALPFVLLSKLDLKKWLTNQPSAAERSDIINIITSALSRTGPDPDPAREMLHGLQRKHLFQLFRVDNNHHYLEILKIMLSLSERNQLDPNVWLDLLNTVTHSPGMFSLEYQTRDERLSAINNFVAAENDINLQETANILAEIQLHFHNERLHFGLYGLYPKYRPYLEALAAYFSLMGLKIIVGQVKLDKGRLNTSHLDVIWTTLECVYGPWLFPLSSTDRQSAATWIQQLTNENSLLPPWIPGDCGLATSMLHSMMSCVKTLMGYDSSSIVLSKVMIFKIFDFPILPIFTNISKNNTNFNLKVWKMYATHWAQSGVKDHVFGVLHPVLSSLDWSSLSPTQQDLDLMVKVMELFLPSCHAFLGTFFVQIKWTNIVSEAATAQNYTNLLPSLLCLLVKLSGEPNVRQSGTILSILKESETWDWSHVDISKYESLAQWLVMSIECRCLVKHHERNPLDEATLKLFKASAEFGSDHVSDNGVKKQKVWIKCCTRLMSSCSSKHKNFLSHNQPALHSSIRRILEDISYISNIDNLTSTAVIKDFLTLLNSNNSSVLPGSSLMVLQSWLTHQDHNSSSLHSLLNLSAVCINEVRTATTVVEAVLDTCFKENDTNTTPSWTEVLDHISWPTGTRIQQLLEQAIQSGHVLVLYSYLRYRRPLAGSVKEEQMFTSTMLDWLRNLTLDTGVEPKLPLLYTQMIQLLQRQNQFNTDQGWIVNMILQLCDVLTNIADSSPGWSQNLLGAIGLANSNVISHKGKFLARALMLYLRLLINFDKSNIVEKILDEDGAASRKFLLNSAEIKPHVDKLNSFKSNKAFSGIHDLLDWVLQQIKDETNTLANAHLFIDHIVIDKLYVELYLQN